MAQAFFQEDEILGKAYDTRLVRRLWAFVHPYRFTFLLTLGFILLAPHGFAGSPYVACIGVGPEARGQSVGSQLMAFAEQRYRDRGHLFLLVSSFNERAQQFYRRHGYEFTGELKDFLVPGHSELIFHKRLP